MKDTIYEDDQPVLYDTESPILFSATVENKLGLGITWRPWKPYILQVSKRLSNIDVHLK